MRINMINWATEYELMQASPEYVFQWLKENALEERNLSQPDRSELEESLFLRNNELINFGLALYGTDCKLSYKIYQQCNHQIKRASLSGLAVSNCFKDTWLTFEDVIPEILKQFGCSNKKKQNEAYELLSSMLSNQHVPAKIIENLYTKTDEFSNLDDESWLCLIGMTTNNNLLKCKKDMRDYVDGWDWYSSSLIFEKAWKLFDILPINSDSAAVLTELGENLKPTISNDITPLSIINRWQLEDEKQSVGFSFGNYSSVRKVLVKLISTSSKEFKALVHDEDIALREGFYLNVKYPAPQDVDEWLAKDGKVFLSNAVLNPEFFKNRNVRNALRKACKHNIANDEYEDYSRTFQFSYERYLKKHPEWFEDENSDLLTDYKAIKDFDERIERRIEHLSTDVKELGRLLLGEHGRFAREEDTYGIGDNYEDRLQSIREDIAKLTMNHSPVPKGKWQFWMCFLLGLVVGISLMA